MPLVVSEQKASFRRDGYLTLDGVSDREDLSLVEDLLDGLYARWASLPPANLRDHGDPADASPAARVPEINQTVVLEPRLRTTQVFLRCRRIANELLGTRCTWYFDHSIYKPPRCTTSTPWHQDHSYSDAEAASSIQFWIPLHDVDRESGCMWFLPGCALRDDLVHRRAHTHPRGHTLEVIGVDTSSAVAVPLHLGDATVHGSRTLHATGPNQSDHPRKAWILGFGPLGRLDRLRPTRLLDATLDWLSGS